MLSIGTAFIGSSPQLWGPSRPRTHRHGHMPCDFCASQRARWRYSARGSSGWNACERCHGAIEADDQQALLERVAPSTLRMKLPSPSARRSRRRARALHDAFWLKRAGTAEAL